MSSSVFSLSPSPSPSSSTSTSSDNSEEDYDISFDKRLSPSWETYQSLFEQLGYHLDSACDVRLYYEQLFPGGIPDSPEAVCQRKAYKRACEMRDDELCRDEGLPETLFRGTCKRRNKRIVVKATGLCSRQHTIVRLLSSKPLRDDPMNHTIPVLDIIEVPESQLAFIVQEEWSSEIIDTNNPCPLPVFLHAIRQCIEGLVFMHSHGIAHLDISLRNILTDFGGHYAYIDFETSRLYPFEKDPIGEIVGEDCDGWKEQEKKPDGRDTSSSDLQEGCNLSGPSFSSSSSSFSSFLSIPSHTQSISSPSSISSSPSSSISPSPNPSFIYSAPPSLLDLGTSDTVSHHPYLQGQDRNPSQSRYYNKFKGKAPVYTEEYREHDKIVSPPRTIVHTLAYKGCEVPPELEDDGVHGESRMRDEKAFDPFKVDTWALSVVILRACKLCGYDDPEFVRLTQRGLLPNWEERASAVELLDTFDRTATKLLQGKIPPKI